MLWTSSGQVRLGIVDQFERATVGKAHHHDPAASATRFVERLDRAPREGHVDGAAAFAAEDVVRFQAALHANTVPVRLTL